MVQALIGASQPWQDFCKHSGHKCPVKHGMNYPVLEWCMFLGRLKSLCFVCSMHYRMYLRGVSPYALILNVTFFATDGPDNTGTDRLILTKAFGLPNGPSNPTGGFGVPQNGTTFVLTT